MTHNIGWNVSLSNGENFQEGKGKYQNIKGELSPWLRLTEYIKENRLSITSLHLSDGERSWHLPSHGKNPKFSVFAYARRPHSYRFFRKMGKDIKADGSTGSTDIFTVIDAHFDSFRLQLWVSEDGVCRTVIL